MTIATLVDGYVRAEDMAEAEAIVAQMEKRGIKGNIVVYNTLLRGYARIGRTQVGCSGLRV